MSKQQYTDLFLRYGEKKAKKLATKEGVPPAQTELWTFQIGKSGKHLIWD